MKIKMSEIMASIKNHRYNIEFVSHCECDFFWFYDKKFPNCVDSKVYKHNCWTGDALWIKREQTNVNVCTYIFTDGSLAKVLLSDDLEIECDIRNTGGKVIDLQYLADEILYSEIPVFDPVLHNARKKSSLIQYLTKLIKEANVQENVTEWANKILA